MEHNSYIRDILESIVVFALILVLCISNLLTPLNYMLADRLYQPTRGVNNKIKIIAIDEKTLDAYGRIDTWSRSRYADLINVLNSSETGGPDIIAFDITFASNVDEGDKQFADIAKESGNVVTVSQLIYNSVPRISDSGLVTYEIDNIVKPYDELEAVVNYGYASIAQDSDNVVRRVMVSDNYNGNEVKVFPLVIYEKYCEKKAITANTIKTDDYGRMIINYSGKPGSYEAVSMVDVMDGKVDPRAFTGCIVFVGAYAAGMQDSYSVPAGGSQDMYGVEIHANILQSFMDERYAVAGNLYIYSLIYALIGALLHFLYKRSKKVWISAIALVLAVATNLIVCKTLNENGIYISVLYLPLVTVLSFVYSLAINYISEYKRRKQVVDTFKKYMAPSIVEEISKKKDFKVTLSGENRDIAVLFVDIRGFTTMSENLEPEQVVQILNKYLALTTKSIFDNSGTLDKFVGDATMAVFNSPFDLEDYEFKAVCAAWDIVEGGKALEKELMEEFGRSVGFGVGVNVGPAVVGNIGCEFRMDYTAIGDTVNTSARLEANAKKGQVLISDVLYERVKERIEVEPIGEIPLKGKSKGVFVYSVTAVHR